MEAHEHPADNAGPDQSIPEDLVAVGIYRTTQEGFDHSVVVLALGYACWLMPFDTVYRLFVESSKAAQVRAELTSYDGESVGWPPRLEPDKPAMVRLDFVTPLLWALVVLTVFRGQWRHPEWIEAGALDAAAIFEHHEVWRILTALFLHRDAVHLVSNLCSGIFFFAAVLSVFGRLRGWLLLGLAAMAGNFAVAAMHAAENYRSMGASTAVFGALGLLTGRSVRHATGARHPHRGRLLFVPSAAGLIILGLYGAGGPTVDVLAHVTGFVAGALLGFFAGRPVSLATAA